MQAPVKRWAFLAAAGIPCAALLFFCAVTTYEWWLISSHQIVVTPPPMQGTSSVPEVPASTLLPLIFGSAALAALFAFAGLRTSGRALAAGYLALGLLVVVPLVRRML